MNDTRTAPDRALITSVCVLRHRLRSTAKKTRDAQSTTCAVVLSLEEIEALARLCEWAAIDG